jgi:hypothetical protein
MELARSHLRRATVRPMKATWTFHRFERSNNRWIDTPEVDATAGVLAPSKPETEATLSLNAAFSIRDTVWPLAWRLCLEPLRAVLGEGQAQWQYRCFESPTQVTLREADEMVYVRRDTQSEIAFLARELWPALVAAGSRVLALAERDRGPTDRNVALLRPSREQAEAILRERGWM